MARVTSYATLATAVQEYMGNDTSIGVSGGNLDYLCAEVEQEVNARCRVRRMLTAITPTVSSAGVVTLPTDFIGWKRFQVRDGEVEWDLDLVPPERTTDISRLYGETGVPKALIMLGTTSQIWPYTDGVYTFRAQHYLRIPDLASGAGTNWLITDYPMAYLYGCLAAARALKHDDTPAMAARFDLWDRRFKRVIDQINREDAWDLDARKSATLSPDTTLFSGGGKSNIEAGV